MTRSNQKQPPILYVVVPCYNEEDCIDSSSNILYSKISDLIKRRVISSKSTLVLVDDGSTDKTWLKITSLKYSNIVGIKLTRNYGHQNALLAGLMYSKDFCDITISIDADLQDDVDTIDKFIDEYVKGSEVVYGARSERKKDSFFKRNTAQTFYKIMKILGVDVVYNSADFRLLSRKVLEELSDFREFNLFLRGIIPLIGHRKSVVLYRRKERLQGESKYPLKKMLNFAWDGITSFSIKPIRLVLSIGMITSLLSIIAILYSVISWSLGNTVNGWTFLICSIWLLGGVQMASIGLIGEYIGKTYIESKNRPRYFIEYIKSNNKKKNEKR